MNVGGVTHFLLPFSFLGDHFSDDNETKSDRRRGLIRFRWWWRDDWYNEFSQYIL